VRDILSECARLGIKFDPRLEKAAEALACRWELSRLIELAQGNFQNPIILEKMAEVVEKHLDSIVAKLK